MDKRKPAQEKAKQPTVVDRPAEHSLLSAEREAELRSTAANFRDVRDALAEVDRLRTIVAAMVKTLSEIERYLREAALARRSEPFGGIGEQVFANDAAKAIAKATGKAGGQ